MIRVLLPLVIFFFFVFEGTVMQVFSADYFDVPYAVVPRFVMVMVLFVAFFMKRSTALIYGLVFGLGMDVIYSDYIGVYMFTIAFTGYIMASIVPLFHINVLTTLFLGLLGVVILEFQVYGLYAVIGIAPMPMNVFLYERLMPTLVLNGAFIILVYYPMQRYFRAYDAVKREQKRQWAKDA